MDGLWATIYIYIAIIYIYSLQGETLHYNAEQQYSPLGDGLRPIAFRDNQAKSRTLAFAFFLRHSADLCMQPAAQRVQIKILTLNPPNCC